MVVVAYDGAEFKHDLNDCVRVCVGVHDLRSDGDPTTTKLVCVCVSVAS